MQNDNLPPAKVPAASHARAITLGNHLAFMLSGMMVLMAMHSLLRLALLIYNKEQIGGATAGVVSEAFLNGLRFDLRLVVLGCIPLLLALPSRRAINARRLLRFWLTVFASVTLFLGVIELDFYREFNQRLNGLVFQYLKEDPGTVLSMLWYGFPVLRYLLAWALATGMLAWTFGIIDRHTRRPVPAQGNAALPDRFVARWLVFALAIVLSVIAVRGTLRQGPPLRWGDAFTTDSVFVNQLGLNGTLSLISAARGQFSEQRDNIWKSSLPAAEALAIVRQMLLTQSDRLLESDRAPVLREYNPSPEKTLPVRNVVLILMESFAGRHVGALGGQGNVTPYFDRLAEEGLLFTRFFSNGTHTHQGMFASIGCFPNLPAFEYLMQTPEASNDFSGLPQLLRARDMDDLFVYNGDFSWDNQSGFFGRQGMTNFIGRFDYVDPVVSDPTWGVSDQDMFERAAGELSGKDHGKPFYAVLQTLSNHTPYAIPKDLPVEKVTGQGPLDDHLTAMRYSDWALGKFFERVRHEPYFKETLFVVVGDHGFGSGEQLTEMNLARFNVPLLMIAPGIREKFGRTRDLVGTQVDIVPTIMGRLGGAVRHQCWGRDLLNLPADDPGFGVIKPSGTDQTVAIVSGGRILIESKTKDTKSYDYQLWNNPHAVERTHDAEDDTMRRKMDAYIQVATKSLLENTTGIVPPARK